MAEFGCGSARLLARIGREKPLELVAIDYSESALRLVDETARAFEVKIEPVLGDVTGLSFPDATYDMVLSGGCSSISRTPAPC